MKLLLLGRDGQVGTALTARLAELGTVVALGRDGADFEVPGTLADRVAEHAPDVIVNAAAYTAVDKAESEAARAFRINGAAVGELAGAAAATGALLIHYSTDYVFDGSGETPWVETDPTAPLNVYGASKRAGEEAIAASGARHLIFRTSWVHAPGGNNFMAKILKAARERDELKVIDDQIGAPTSAALIADVTISALRAERNGAPIASGLYHLAAAGETSWHGYASFAIAAARAAGVAIKVAPDRIHKVASDAFPTPARRPQNSRLSTAKLGAALSYRFPDWQDDVMPTLQQIVAEARS